MPKAAVQEQSNYFYEEGWVDATLKSCVEYDQEYTLKPHHKAVKDGEARAGDTASFPKWRWSYELTSGPNAGRTIDVETNDRVTTKDGDLVRLQAEAFLGRELEVGEEVDTDLYEGMDIQLYITHRDPRPGRDGQTKYYCDVTEFAPSDGRAKAAFEDEPPF